MIEIEVLPYSSSQFIRFFLLSLFLAYGNIKKVSFAEDLHSSSRTPNIFSSSPSKRPVRLGKPPVISESSPSGAEKSFSISSLQDLPSSRVPKLCSPSIKALSKRK